MIKVRISNGLQLVCRVYCVLLRPDIEALLAGPQKVVPSEGFFRLLVAVHQLDNLAIQWCGGQIGEFSYICLACMCWCPAVCVADVTTEACGAIAYLSFGKVPLLLCAFELHPLRCHVFMQQYKP